MFNLSGSEIIVILLAALVVLGPEKLPEAIRRFGRVYGEVKRVSRGFQSEFNEAFKEPLSELKETARLTKEAVSKGFDEVDPPARTDATGTAATGDPEPSSAPEPTAEPGTGTDPGGSAV